MNKVPVMDYTINKDRKLNITFIYTIVVSIIAVVALIIGAIALYLSLKDDKKISLFTKGVSESRLLSNSDYNTLFTYYTQANSATLKKYSGYYEVSLNNSSAINFRITDENDVNITGKIVKGGPNLPSKIYFNSPDKISEIKLKYNTNSDNIILQRIDLII